MSAARTIRDRAAAALDVVANAPAGVARAAFLKRLTADGFAPPEEAVWAANALAGTRLPLSEGGRAEVAAIEAEIVDRFAREYWSIPPGVRRERWNELAGQLTDADAKARMAELGAGLSMAAAPRESRPVEAVAAVIRDLFVLRPRDRIIRRTLWLFEHSDQALELRDAARQLRLEDFSLDALDPTLTVQLESDSPLEAIAPLAPGLSVVDRAEQDEFAAAASFFWQRSDEPIEDTPPQSDSKGCLILLIGPVAAIFVLIASQFIPSCNWGKNKTRPEYRYEPPQPPAEIPASRQYTYEEMRSFLEFEQRQAAGAKDEIPPPKYLYWRLSGGSFKATKR
ncbi:MAG: hypothetical protein U0791_03725 [Gemmataceae bacterium]